MTKFEWALAHTLGWEKGLADHAKDPGGRTNLGITQATLNAAREEYPELNLPMSVDELTVAQATSIYQRKYWDACHCSDLPQGLAIAVFDAAVNTNASKVRKWLQKSLGVQPDGWIGPRTIAAAKACNLKKTISEFHSLRAFNYMLLDDIDDDFGLGWSRRLIDTHNVAMGFGL